MLSKLGVTAPITGPVAVGAGIISVHAGTCAIIGKGMVINFPLVGSPIPWCE